MSMFVGAVTPRQNTAFASEEVSVRIAATETRAALSNIMRRMGIPRKSAVHVLAWEALQHSPGKYRSKLVLNLSQPERARKRVVTASCPEQGIACACKAAIPSRERVPFMRR